MSSVLFVCTGNQYRSPIAAAAFLKRLDREGKAGTWTVDSSGTWTAPGLPPYPDAVEAARAFGLSLEAHRTSSIEARDLSAYDLILVMERGHRDAILSEFPASRGKVYLLSDAVDHVPYDIPDPAARNTDLEAVARNLCDLIERGYASICQLASAQG